MKIAYLVKELIPGSTARLIQSHLDGFMGRGHQVALFSDKRLALCGMLAPLGARYEPADWDVSVACDWKSAEELNERGGGLYLVNCRQSALNPRASWSEDAERTYTYRLKAIATSHWLKQVLEQYGHRPFLVGWGVNRSLFYEQPVFPKKEGYWRVLITGHEADATQNQRDAHKVIEKLRLANKRIEVWGFGPLGVGRYHYDRFVVRPDEADIRQIYSSCDVLLKTDGLCQGAPSALEAMACGLPVVLGVGPGVDGLQDGEHCLSCDHGDVAALAQACRRILEDPDYAEDLRQAGLAYSLAHPWEPILEQLEEIYHG